MNPLKKWMFFFQPYLKDLMDEVYNYYFANATTDFEKSDQVVVLLSDLLVIYSIEEWLIKHVAISQKNTYYQRYSRINKMKKL